MTVLEITPVEAAFAAEAQDMRETVTAARGAAVMDIFGPDSEEAIMATSDERLQHIYGLFDQPDHPGQGFLIRGDAYKVPVVRDSIIMLLGRMDETERDELLVDHIGGLAGAQNDPRIRHLAEVASAKAGNFNYVSTRGALKDLCALAVQATAQTR